RWSRGRRLPRRAVAVTFDDGFADNATCALPILQRHGIPATVFVSSGYVGSRSPFWFDGLARWVNTTRAEQMTIDGEVWPLADMDSRRRAGWAALGHLKRLAEPRRQEQLAAWKGEIGEEAVSDERSRPLSRTELQSLVEGGVSIGSHTVTHPILSRCDDATLRHELTQSRKDLEAMTGVPVTTLSYPVGGADAHDLRVRAAAREAGYRLACAYVPGFNSRRSADLFALRRQRVERYIGQERFRAMLACPEVFK
ncbi:MAG: polysaccharide deacetylase family protein, partial [Pseudomonadota bacterium]